MRAPVLYWVCVAWLILTVILTGFTFAFSFLPYRFMADKIEGALALVSYTLGTIAFIGRRKIAVPLLLVGLVVGLGGMIWAITTRGGFGAHFSHSGYWIGRLIGVVIFMAVIGYGVSLTRRGILR